MNDPIQPVIEMLDKLGITHKFGQDGVLYICIHTSVGPVFISISIFADIWVGLSTTNLFEYPVNESNKEVLLPFFYDLLVENDFTKLGRFYINEGGFIEFAVDLRLEDLSADLLDLSIDVIAHFIGAKLPPLADPYAPYLFDMSD